MSVLSKLATYCVYISHLNLIKYYDWIYTRINKKKSELNYLSFLHTTLSIRHLPMNNNLSNTQPFRNKCLSRQFDCLELHSPRHITYKITNHVITTTQT